MVIVSEIDENIHDVNDVYYWGTPYGDYLKHRQYIYSFKVSMVTDEFYHLLVTVAEDPFRDWSLITGRGGLQNGRRGT